MRAPVTAFLVSTLLATGLAISPAAADDTPPPVVTDDTVTLYPGQQTVIDVLANDSSPSGDDLALCRFPVMDPWDEDLKVLVEEMSSDDEYVGLLLVSVHPRAKGTHVVDYYVCDHNRLVPARLTVDIRPVKPVDVEIAADQAGHLQVTNHNDERIQFLFGHRQAFRADGDAWVDPGETVLVHVQRRRIAWVAVVGVSRETEDNGAGIADFGIVRGIKLDGPPLPPPRYRPGWPPGIGASWSYGVFV